jgi:hypothetical protein
MSVDETECPPLQSKVDETEELKADIKLIRHFLALLKKIREAEKQD